jgi:ornithine cyclodeaminase/alanine dehydrogenase-like protein (mu-crystallin family)
MNDIIDQMARLLRERDVEKLVTIADAVEALEFAFREWAAGRVDNQPRRRVRGEVVLAVMSAVLPARQLVGFKTYTAGKQGHRFWVHLYQEGSGQPLAIIEADHLGRLRTGAASAVATKFLASADASVLTLFGAGTQAVTQLQGVVMVRDIREVRVVSRDPERRRRFIAAAREHWHAGEVKEAVDAQAAVAGAHVITTITMASNPVLPGAWLEPGQHLNVCGSNIPDHREVDGEAVQRASLVVADDLAAARLEAGDLLLAEAEGKLDWRRVVSLKDVVSGSVRRTAPEQITLFKSVGLALEDLALAAVVLERAERAGVGESLPL